MKSLACSTPVLCQAIHNAQRTVNATKRLVATTQKNRDESSHGFFPRPTLLSPPAERGESASSMISDLFRPESSGRRGSPTDRPLLAAAREMSYSVRRFHKKVLSHAELKSTTLLEMKRFLRFKTVEFKETFACLKVALPRHLLVGEELPGTAWADVDDATVDVFVNKTTGLVVCPELAISDEWSSLQNFIDVWQKNRHKKKGEELLEYPTLSKMPIQLPEETSKLWSECAPIESLSVQEYKEVLKHLRLPLKDFKLEDFVRFEARVTPNHQEIIFPVRYVDSKSTIVGLRRVWMCPESRSLVEDNLPDGRMVS